MRERRYRLFGLCIASAVALSSCTAGGGAAPENTAERSDFDRIVADARFAIEAGDLPGAGRLLDEALTLKPRDAGLWVTIARLRFRGGEHFLALEAADYALSLDPNLAPAMLLKAQFVRDAYGKAASLRWFEAGLSRHPEDPDLLAEYAATLGDLGRHRDMLTAARKLAEIDPRDPRVHYLQAVLAARAHDPVLASSLLKRSGMADRGVPSAIVVSAIIDMQQANFDNSVTALDQLLVRQPYNIRAAELLARAMWLGGRERELIERFAGYADGPASSPYITMLVGRSFERQGQRGSAARYLQRAADMDAGELAPITETGAVLDDIAQPSTQMRAAVSKGRASEATTLAQRYAADYPQSADIRVLSGDARLSAKDASAALNDYADAARVRRSWPLVRKIIAAYRLSGDDDAADTLLARQITQDPLNSEALVMQAGRSAADADWLRVKVLLDHAANIGAGNDPLLLRLRLQAAEELGDNEQAKAFRAALSSLQPPAFVTRDPD
ncbi:tetratricopeptide repeat protein [Erythrobacter sp. MTPC3]|uniref:tetratricopeptide repeat protein n=1 Tax=Erythrobacter sp. MTPC3 TaxID=3056564 RepID=UPI0036F27FE3